MNVNDETINLESEYVFFSSDKLAKGALLIDYEDPSLGLVIHDLSSLPIGKQFLTPFLNKIERVKDKLVRIGSFKIHILKILPGEIEMLRYDDIDVVIGDEILQGMLIVTNYKMYILKKENRKQIPLLQLRRISKIEKSGGKRKNYILNSQPYEIIIHRNDIFPNILLRFSNGDKEIMIKIHKALKNIIFPSNIRSLFCFDNKEYLSSQFEMINWKYTLKNLKSVKNINIDGWKLYEPENEYKRIKVDYNYWRWTDVNLNYSLCSSYPSKFIVPKELKDSQLFKMADFRIRERIPVLSWHHENGSSIVRCSQPKPSIKYKTFDDDEALSLIKRSRKENEKKLVLIDPRSSSSNTQTLREGNEEFLIEFVGIDSYQEIKKSFSNLKISCQEKKDAYWLSSLDSSGWLKNIKNVLNAAHKIINLVHMENTSCLIQSGDSSDRTTQIISLALLCLDPFYRTITGFCVLIEKEWRSFGHMFNSRSGGNKEDTDLNSPIFLQWIDCVWQLLHQNPLCFEFNEYFLIDILNEAFNCRFGTFITDNEYQAFENSVMKNTPSLWTHIHNVKNIYKYFNLYYTPSDPLNSDIKKVIYPNVHMSSLKFWYDLYFAYLPHKKREMKLANKANMERILKIQELEQLIKDYNPKSHDIEISKTDDDEKSNRDDGEIEEIENRRLRLLPPSLANLTIKNSDPIESNSHLDVV